MESFELFFVVRIKQGRVLYAEHGPFTTEELARPIAKAQPRNSCHSGVAKVTMTCEMVEEYEL
jgi:hypothetical protein